MTTQQPIPLPEGTKCNCFGESGFCASTFTNADGQECCDFCSLPVASAPDLARENAELRQRVEVLEAGLTQIRAGARLGSATFMARVEERKDRLTWWAVNVLQDNLAACEGTADTALAQASEPRQ